MYRPVFVALVCSAVFAGSAQAATVGVLDGPDLTAVALAGPDAVVLRETTRSRHDLLAVPRGGGGKAVRLASIKRMRWHFEIEPRRLAASAARVALIAEIIDGNGGTVAWRVYSGPPRGPVQLVRSLGPREQWAPVVVDVDGDRVLLVESRPEGDGPIRAFVSAGVGGGFVPIGWASAAKTPIELSGGFAAATMAAPNRVGVVDAATGAEVATIPLDERERTADLSLAPDGRMAAATRAGVTLVGPGVAPRLLPGTKGLSQVHLTGSTVTAIDTKGRAVAVGIGGGRLTALGPPTRVLTGAAGDATGYAWIANGCARVATIPVSNAPVGKRDPCPTTEIGFYYIASTKLRRGNLIDVPVRCVAAPRGVCRGTAIARIYEGDGKAAATGRFAVPVGRERQVKLRVTRAALAIFRREGFGNLVMDARIRNGRVGVGADGEAELSVDLPGRDE